MPRTKTAAPAEGQMEGTQVFRAARKRYRLLKQISESPTSTVWLAQDTLSGSEVVVKRLSAASIQDPIARRRLEEEAAASQLVSHPNAVPVLDELFDERDAALVFPYVAGRTLAERLHHGVAMDPRNAASVALDVADVLAAAHSAGVVHRDVKPANILLGDDGRTRLVDFGIARALDEPATGRGDGLNVDLTGSGMAVGTLPYMAPEQLTGARPAPAADVYSLGVVLHEMLAGRRPYEGGSPAEQLELQQRPPPPISGPAALTALVTSALDPMPERRPSAAQLGRSLSAWFDGRAEPEARTTVVPVAPAPLPLPAPLGATRMTAPVMALIGVFLAAIVAVPAAMGLLGATSAPGSDIVPTDSAVQPATPGEATLAESSAEPERQQAPRQRQGSGPAGNDDTGSNSSQNESNQGKDQKDKKSKPGKGHDRDDDDDDDDDDD